MKQAFLAITALLLLSAAPLQAQLKNVIVETYYISDTKDASDSVFVSDSNGNVYDTLSLPAGSTTYRIYLDLSPGSKVRKIYGDANHTLRIASDSVFFNNADRGKSYGYQIKKNDLKKGTVPLDTWLTLGQATATIPQTAPLKPYAFEGSLKILDKDSSFIGAHHNNGGSSAIPGGLITSTDPQAGIPVDSADGYIRMDSIPSNWADGGIVVNGIDSTIFGSLSPGKEFLSNNAFLQNDGTSGAQADSNQVLLAQLTTRGKISFELNVEIILPDKTIIKYVAKNGADSLSPSVVQSHFLKYPPECGCNDPNFIEFNPQIACIDSQACKTRIVLGCMDPYACNFNPQANRETQPSLCCYPGNCNDRDISLVCLDLSVQPHTQKLSFEFFPNPVQNDLHILLSAPARESLVITIYDISGKALITEKLQLQDPASPFQLDVSALPPGFYLLQMRGDETAEARIFIKN